MKDQDAYSVNSKKSNASKYKKYNIRDYNNLKANVQSQKLGGLGANIGTEEWEMAKRKKEIQTQYANNLKELNAVQPTSKPLNKISRFGGGDKDRTARDRALEFAKNVPKPKLTRNKELAH
jgi:hypothetical protein